MVNLIFKRLHHFLTNNPTLSYTLSRALPFLKNNLPFFIKGWRRIGQRIAGAPVIEPAALPQRRGSAIVISVSGIAARTEARARAAALGLCEGRDFVVAA